MLQGETELIIDGPVGSLQAVYTLPQQPDQSSSILAIICHPNPLQQGTMNNKVVVTTARALRDLNVASIRFNARGVGESEGEYHSKQDALDDMQAVMNWAAEQFAPRGILLAGFSFGSYVAFQAAQTCPDLIGLICIAPPVDRLDFQVKANLQVPWLVLFGLQDEVVPAEQMQHWAEQVQPTPQLVTFPEVGHFFHGKLSLLQRAINQYAAPLITTLTGH